jgi:hypothetical protein
MAWTAIAEPIEDRRIDNPFNYLFDDGVMASTGGRCCDHPELEHHFFERAGRVSPPCSKGLALG